MSRSERLDLGDFERLVAVHGAQLERWPEELSGSARELLEVSELARARLSEARRLDEWLDAAPAAEPSSELMARVAALPARHPRPPGARLWPFGNVWAPLLAWGAAAALGLMVGLAVPALEGSEDAAPAAVDEVGQSEDWSELSELALGAGWALEEE